jgi:hypothetical protein
MNTLDANDLSALVIRVLERTAMVPAEAADAATLAPPPTRFARIAYSGPSCGTLTLGATDAFLAEVVSGLLGVEAAEVDLEQHGEDTLTELANTVGGSLIVALSEDRCEYALGLPAVATATDLPAGAPVACRVSAGAGVLSVSWIDVEPAADVRGGDR